MRLLRQPVRVGLDRPWTVVTATAVVGFILAVVAYTRWHALGSDDVAIQNIVDSVLAGQPLQPAVGNDNFIVKVPIYLLVGLLPHTTWTLALTIIVCNVPLIVALLVIGRRLLANTSVRRQLFGGALICWYLCAQLVLIAPSVQINGRNGEIGVALLLLWWRLPIARGSRVADAVRSVVSVAAFALLFFSDLFFLFVLVPTVAALLVTSVVIGRFRARCLQLTAELAAAALLALWLLGRAQAAGMVISQNFASATPAATELPGYLAAAAAAVGRDLNADVWGMSLSSALVPGLLQLLLLLVVVVLSVRAALDLRRTPDIRVTALSWIALVNVVLFVMTSNAADPLSYRYVFLAAIVLLLLALKGTTTFAWPTSVVGARLVRGVVLITAVAVVFGIGANAVAVVRSRGATDPQARVRAIIELAESRGLTTGIGSYWDGNITTWYSDGRVRVLPQACGDSGFQPFVWLINAPEMRRSVKARFVVLSDRLGCTADRARATFGRPTDSASLPDGDRVWFYERPVSASGASS